MSSSNEDDSNDSKRFIDKLLGEMKSEFNKNIAKNSKNNDTSSEMNDLPPKLKVETETSVKNSDSDLPPPNITKIETITEAKPISKQINNKGNKTPTKCKTVEDETEEIVLKNENENDVEEEAKPRIVLKFRTDKSKNNSFSADKDSAEESTSPGRRSLRNKPGSSEEKEIKKSNDAEFGLKRSARRRSKDCTESILKSAIARKEKSYNETVRPQRKLKPTAKILANLEMCQKNAALKNERNRFDGKNKNITKSPTNERQRFSYDKLEKGTEQAILESDLEYMKHEEEQQHKKFKRKKHNSIKIQNKKARFIKEETRDSNDSDSSLSSPQETEAEKESFQEELNIKQEIKRSPRKSSSDTDSSNKPSRRSIRKLRKSLDVEENDNVEICEPLSGTVADQENLIPDHPESTVIDTENIIIKCLCQQSSQIFMSPTGTTYCTAIDMIDNRIIGCNNSITGEVTMLRPSTRFPYIILCEVHKQRLIRHNCCPTCGLFCTQGRFAQCPSKHQYHRDCSVVVDDKKFCPHCGLNTPEVDIEIVMKCGQGPVFLPIQKCHYPSAKMTFQSVKQPLNKEVTLNHRSCSPPIIPIEELESMKSATLDEEINETFDINDLYEASKKNDCGRVANILKSEQVSMTEPIPNCDGMMLLHYASQEGFITIVHLLIVAGAEHDVLDKEQNTPLMLAVQAFKNDVVKYLIKSGASITLKGTDGMSALHLAAKHGNLEACEYLISADIQNSKTYINSVDDGGWTPLVWACEHGHVIVTKYLLQNGADPLLRDVEQNVALHWAAFSGSSQIMEMLLNSGCDVNSINAHGDSPLHVSARQDKYNCVLILLARGANVYLVNKSEETPLTCCVSELSECYTAISLNVQLQSVAYVENKRKRTILTNDISRGNELNPVQCVNTIDDEAKPTDFVYIIENCLTSDINIDKKITTLQGCSCEDRCATVDCLCSNNSLKCWYTEDGRLSNDFNYADPPMIFECNPSCGCNSITCYNRVVQHGLTQRFQLFRTENKGWGIQTLRLIPRGSYVCEYIGEIISDLEADQREDDSYLFDLDNRVCIYSQDGETYCIDARRYGNLSRFINHSCNPNLLPVRVYINHQDLRFPRIAFFANRDIQANEELGFDYGEKFWIIKYKSFTCTCNYSSCKYSESTIKITLENYQKRLLEEQELLQGV